MCHFCEKKCLNRLVWVKELRMPTSTHSGLCFFLLEILGGRASKVPTLLCCKLTQKVLPLRGSLQSVHRIQRWSVRKPCECTIQLHSPVRKYIYWSPYLLLLWVLILSYLPPSLPSSSPLLYPDRGNRIILWPLPPTLKTLRVSFAIFPITL